MLKANAVAGLCCDVWSGVAMSAAVAVASSVVMVGLASALVVVAATAVWWLRGRWLWCW